LTGAAFTAAPGLGGASLVARELFILDILHIFSGEIERIGLGGAADLSILLLRASGKEETENLDGDIKENRKNNETE